MTDGQNYRYSVKKYNGTNDTTPFDVIVMREYCGVYFSPSLVERPSICITKIVNRIVDSISTIKSKRMYTYSYNENEFYGSSID